MAQEVWRELGQVESRKSIMIPGVPIVLIPGALDQELDLNAKRTKASVLSDNRLAIESLYKICSVLNCVNVTTRVSEPSEKLAKKRKKKGAAPLYSYHVLDLDYIDDEDDNAHPSPGVSGNGRSSPRTHIRRGHLRRKPKGVVWVRPTMVNKAAKGVVEKDYRLGR